VTTSRRADILSELSDGLKARFPSDRQSRKSAGLSCELLPSVTHRPFSSIFEIDCRSHIRGRRPLRRKRIAQSPQAIAHCIAFHGDGERLEEWPRWRMDFVGPASLHLVAGTSLRLSERGLETENKSNSSRRLLHCKHRRYKEGRVQRGRLLCSRPASEELFVNEKTWQPPSSQHLPISRRARSQWPITEQFPNSDKQEPRTTISQAPNSFAPPPSSRTPKTGRTSRLSPSLHSRADHLDANIRGVLEYIVRGHGGC